ncbi:MAG: ABC transporter ATP-binding protein [Bacteroidetes bacterium]|nr:MAG: ABC transporter ATP-binding protein [Bacteroidota bacterium]
MNILSASGLSKSFTERILFENLTLGVSLGEKIALVGINGSGKSTLLTVLAGAARPDTGEVSLRKGTKMAYLSQNPEFEDHLTVWQAIFESETPILQTIRAYQKSMAEPEKYQDQIPDILEKMDTLQAWDYENKVEQVLSKLSITDYEQKVNSLSGGQKKRIALAKMLLEEADLFIMDEPTNHLDLSAIEWLENYLSSSQKSVILVTHDRYFLDSVCNVIFELENGNIYRYTGKYGDFLEKKAERQEQMNTEIDKAQNLMRKELEWIRRQPKARGTKAKYRVENFDKIKEKASQSTKTEELLLSTGFRRQGKKIMEIEKISKSFGEKVLFKDFSYVFQRYDRIGIVGKNGVGKSTFLQMLTGTLPPDSGVIDKGQNTVFGYYTQQELIVKEDKRMIELVKEVAEVIKMDSGEVITASQLLTHFQFSPKVQYTPVSKLSGGEKRRLQLLMVLMKNPNFLVLDEPTNDLDILTLNILEDFLINYSGCLLLVSHDRYFMDRVTDHLFVFEGNGEIRDFGGNYSDYKEMQALENETPKIKEAPAPKIAEPAKINKASFKEKEEYKRLEQEIEGLEKQKAKVLEKLNQGIGKTEELIAWSKSIGEFDKEISKKTDRWLELSEIL